MKYIVAISKKEAVELRDLMEKGLFNPHGILHSSKKDAEVHLREIREPPTDPHYGNQYSIYGVEDLTYEY